MDILSIVGFLGAFVVLVVGSILKGSSPSALVGSAAFVIVICGTTCAILLQTPKVTFIHAMKLAKWVFKPPLTDNKALIGKIVEWSNAARKQGLLALEASVELEADAFIKKGLQLLVDGAEPDMIRSVLEVEMGTHEHFNLQGAKVWEGMGIYAPTLGIIGAVLGLMAVMRNLADPSQLGHGISAAFIATIYGIGAANMFLLPMASKLKSIIAGQTRSREMLIEGLISISRGDNPRNIEAKLQGFFH